MLSHQFRRTQANDFYASKVHRGLVDRHPARALG
jgi:hypothetical protein